MKETKESLLGAMMTAEYQGAMISWMTAWGDWVAAWARLHKGRRRRK